MARTKLGERLSFLARQQALASGELTAAGAAAPEGAQSVRHTATQEREHKETKAAAVENSGDGGRKRSKPVQRYKVRPQRHGLLCQVAAHFSAPKLHIFSAPAAADAFRVRALRLVSSASCQDAAPVLCCRCWYRCCCCCCSSSSSSSSSSRARAIAAGTQQQLLTKRSSLQPNSNIRTYAAHLKPTKPRKTSNGASSSTQQRGSPNTYV